MSSNDKNIAAISASGQAAVWLGSMLDYQYIKAWSDCSYDKKSSIPLAKNLLLHERINHT